MTERKWEFDNISGISTYFLRHRVDYGIGQKDARATEKKYYPRHVGWQEGSHAYARRFGRQGRRFFYEQAPLQKRAKLRESLQLSVPQARNFVACLSMPEAS